MIPFDDFWMEYPRKVGKMKAEKIWRKIPFAEQRAALQGLHLWKQTAQWRGSGGMYIPYASTFLAQRRWEDEPWTGAFKEKP